MKAKCIYEFRGMTRCLTSRRSPVRVWDRPPLTLCFQASSVIRFSLSPAVDPLNTLSSGQDWGRSAGRLAA